MGAFDSWDNLHPYGSDANAVWVDNGEHNDGMGTLGDVDISIVPDNGGYVLTIATAAETPYVGEGFVAGEWIVIPINLRNGSSVALNLGAGARAGTLILEYSWLTNTGTRTAWESGQEMARDFKGGNVWAPLDGWRGTIPGYGGKSGSAVIGAKVLFIKISVPPDVIPADSYEVAFSLARGVTP